MDSCKLLNGVQTPCLSFGRETNNVDDVRVAIIVIPGNPGTIEYYREFMTTLHQSLQLSYPNSIVPLWGISHAGHQTNGILSPFPSLKDNLKLYNLYGQIKHKMAFFTEFVPSHVRLILIGHSIGCKITLEVLNQLENVDNRIIKCYMLFPTIERMAATPNGKFLTRLAPFKCLIWPLLWTVSALPASAHKVLVDAHFLVSQVQPPQCVKTAAMELCNKDVLDRVIAMGYDELATVVDLDEQCIEKHLDKLFFYFGTSDGWCPLDYAFDMLKKFPQLHHEVCKNSIAHAFVLESSRLMADAIHKMICDDFEDYIS